MSVAFLAIVVTCGYRDAHRADRRLFGRSGGHGPDEVGRYRAFHTRNSYCVDLAVVLGPSFRNVILIVLIVLWPQFARQVRGEALSIKEQDFVILAKSMGVSSWKIMWRHIFPNVTPSLLVLATLNVGYVVILEATLAFLG